MDNEKIENHVNGGSNGEGADGSDDKNKSDNVTDEGNGEGADGGGNDELVEENTEFYSSLREELAEQKAKTMRKDGVGPLQNPPADVVARIKEITEILTAANQPLEAPELPEVPPLECMACHTPYAGHEEEFKDEEPGIKRHRCGGLAVII